MGSREPEASRDAEAEQHAGGHGKPSARHPLSSRAQWNHDRVRRAGPPERRTARSHGIARAHAHRACQLSLETEQPLGIRGTLGAALAMPRKLRVRIARVRENRPSIFRTIDHSGSKLVSSPHNARSCLRPLNSRVSTAADERLSSAAISAVE
jgi:hypothetical protein